MANLFRVAGGRWCLAICMLRPVQGGISRVRAATGFVAAAVLVLLLVGCSSERESPEARSAKARLLFDRATRDFHIPSAEAKGAEKVSLQQQAAAAYEQLVREYPDQKDLAAQALRSLGNIHAARGEIAAAVRSYGEVERRFPEQEWELLMALKSAADLLWDAGRRVEAKAYYSKIVSRFDKPSEPQIVQTVVRGSRVRLAE